MTISYQLNIIARIILIVLVSIAGGWYFSAGEPLYNILIFIFILTIQIINLILYVNRINKKINYFFESVKNEDYSLAFPVYKEDKTLYKLSRNLQKINMLIQNIQIENRSQEQYFGAMIEHVGTGIFSINKDGFVIHANSSLKKILGLKQFTHLRQLEKIDGKLAETIRNSKQQDEKLITFKGKKGLITLLIKASTFKSKDQILTLISMQDIKKELDEKELDSWLKLIRVLTHEIMNSIAPVTSLSENLHNYYTKNGEAISVVEVDEKLINMTIKGLQVIREQGQGLTHFVESYRKLTRLPKPRKNMVTVSHLLEKTIMLCKSYLPCKGIKISWEAEDKDLQVYIDENQISQVLINLLKNSAEALHDTPYPEIRLYGGINTGGQVEILVTDNLIKKDPSHPVTRGLDDFEIHDEGYSNIEIIPDVTPLLTTDHPDCTRIIGWTNKYNNSKIVYILPGHDNNAWSDENFRKIIANAIEWTGRKLNQIPVSDY